MFHFKFLLFLVISVVCLVCPAQESSVYKKQTPLSSQENPHLDMELSYLSWKEVVTLKGPGGSEKTYGDYIGNGIDFDYNKYWSPEWGHLIEAGLFFGVANLGGTQAVVPYHETNVRWWGLRASYRLSYRISQQITSSMGPLALYRNINFPAEASATDVKSGTSANYGLSADLKILLNPHWLLRTELGTLFVDASTLWSLNLGYRF